MAKLPVMRGADVVRAFEALGWEVVRSQSSHIILVKDGEMATLSVPDHAEVAKGTLRSLIRQAGVTVDGFVEATK